MSDEIKSNAFEARGDRMQRTRAPATRIFSPRAVPRDYVLLSLLVSIPAFNGGLGIAIRSILPIRTHSDI